MPASGLTTALAVLGSLSPSRAGSALAHAEQAHWAAWAAAPPPGEQALAEAEARLRASSYLGAAAAPPLAAELLALFALSPALRSAAAQFPALLRWADQLAHEVEGGTDAVRAAAAAEGGAGVAVVLDLAARARTPLPAAPTVAPVVVGKKGKSAARNNQIDIAVVTA